ncbi:hypothetical protein EV426DRAFT_450693 [Tirmania nivea]|nr:hypothetical protein EV426DRAFT_450693 [Tirmania nivea]
MVNAAIGGLAKAFLGEDRAKQLEAVLATKAEEAKQARKRTRLTTSKAITGAELLQLHLAQQAQQATPKTPRKRYVKHVSFTRLARSQRSSTATHISVSSSSSPSVSGPSFRDSDSEFESVHSGSEGSTIYVRTPGTIHDQSTPSALPLTPTPAPRLPEISPKPTQNLRVLRPRRK